MKVKVNVKHVPLNQTEKFLNDAMSEVLADLDAAYRENERLLQENKDLRLAESRALSDKKKAEEDFYSIKRKFADICAERDNWQSSYKQMTHGWLDAGKKQHEAEQEAAALVVELKDREERIFILEQRVGMLQEENEEWRDTAEQLSTKVINQNAEINRVTEEAYDLNQKNLELEMTIIELRNAAEIHAEEKAAFETAVHSFNEARKDYEDEIHSLNVEKREWMRKYYELETQKKADDKKCEETCAACNEVYEEVLAERNQLRKDVERLTAERDSIPSSFWNFLVENGIVNKIEQGGNVYGNS
jgi:chromosome segregation ATPase